MASIRPHKDRWRAFVEVEGKRRSKVFETKRAAQDWAKRQEYEIKHHDQVVGAFTLDHAFERYAQEVSPRKRGARWEVVRLERFRRSRLARVKMADLRAADFAEWRDSRLCEVAPASVRRELQLMSSVLTIARREWGWIGQNPLSDVQKPPGSPRRNRLPTPREMEALQIAAGTNPDHTTARAFLAFRFACETGMRAGEIVGLTWDRVDLDRRTAFLPMTKNGEARHVPLSSAAVSILEGLRDRDPVFGLRSASLDVLWRKVRGRAGVDGLNFHDSRHAAITKLAKKLDVLDLARVVGHKDIRMLMIYYEADAEALAKRLD